MWGLGGRYYWGRKDKVKKVEGIVVVFSWMSSQDKHLKNYVHLYASRGWDSLVCHSQFLNLFFPDKAASLALEIVNELNEELKLRPCPVVFASFSGGPKACMYKVIQIIEGKCEEQINQDDDYGLVRNCVSGYIFDSTPVDFVSDLGTRFILHPSILNMSKPPLLATWIAKGISSSLDALFLSKFEAQRADYWQTLYSTVSMGAPYLILCSEDDDLAPFHIIEIFVTRLKELGGEVDLVKWSSSTHVGHFRNYPEEYNASVTKLLGKATATFSRRIQQLEAEKMCLEGPGPHVEISGPFQNPRKASVKLNQTFLRSAIDSNDHFLVPDSLEYHGDRDVGSTSLQEEHKEKYTPLVQFFDVCVPKNIEDWDLRYSPSMFSGRRHSHFNPIKCIRRSRL
ncbi:hypothetical protein CASFOL_027860 [Castilleja foliolosa]|uniref:DUF829 domain-containing protein n=1 Tax=Castilleja foliolosa TaxID=1961234 RepID=A0ABD3CH13_9LAMI